jgi:hypothetical protein
VTGEYTIRKNNEGNEECGAIPICWYWLLTSISPSIAGLVESISSVAQV